jgi:hypothetical protein
MDTPVFSTNKTDRHGIAEILLKVMLNAITLGDHKNEKQQISRSRKTIPKSNLTLENHRKRQNRCH